jgi:hypothetical protein
MPLPKVRLLTLTGSQIPDLKAGKEWTIILFVPRTNISTIVFGHF